MKTPQCSLWARLIRHAVKGELPWNCTNNPEEMVEP